jgi:DNA-binding NarL/FixJ family response regulator
MPTRLLLIDDDATILQALTAKLSALPEIEVRSTTESTGVPKIVLDYKPNLIVCDVDMTPLDGGDVARELRANPATAGYRIVFLTSLVDAQHIARNNGEVGGRRMISKQSPLPAIIERILSEAKSA